VEIQKNSSKSRRRTSLIIGIKLKDSNATLGMTFCSNRSENRGDRTPIELFLAGVASWEPYVERLLIAA
jgi:hypothetical protein